MASVVYSKPREEFRATRKLEEQRFRVFLPLCRTKKDPTPKPLFPRYLFVWVPEGRPWRPIVNTPGVCDVLRMNEERAGGNSLATVPDSVIVELKSRMEADGGAILVGDNGPPERKFEKDQPIRIVGGVNIGLEGFYVSKSNDRIEALLNMFGRMVRTSVPEKFVA